MKKALSLILSAIMLLSASSISLVANAVEFPSANVKQTVAKANSNYAGLVSSLAIPTSLEANVSLDKKDYEYGDEIKINLNIVNATNKQLDTFAVRNKLSHKSLTVGNRTDMRQTVLAAGESCTKTMSAYRIPTLVGSSVIYQVENLIEELLIFLFKLFSMFPGSRIVCASDIVYFTYAGIPTYMHTYVFAFVSDDDTNKTPENPNDYTALAINNDVLSYDESIDLYKVNGTKISGTADKETVSAVKFETTDEKKILISKGEAVLDDGEWFFEDFRATPHKIRCCFFDLAGKNIVDMV